MKYFIYFVHIVSVLSVSTMTANFNQEDIGAFIPTFRKSVDDDYDSPSFALDPEADIWFTPNEILTMTELFDSHRHSATSLPVSSYVIHCMNVSLVGRHEQGTSGIIIKYKVRQVHQFVNMLRSRIQEYASYPYNYISYGRTEQELNEICQRYSATSNEVIANSMRFRIRETPLAQFKKVIPLNMKFMIAEILLTQNYATNARMVRVVRREIDYLNEHKEHAVSRLTGNDCELILNEIQETKNKIGRFIEKSHIKVPRDLELELFRHERIFHLLKTEQQMEDELSANVKKVVQSSDLNRYIMGFIN